ncbi:M57 family metalloprotease [Winogradskyella sp.]|uniref:M57 family metalloprotease n=1 Tax=Winogradskyella sp. TaxID=1883156 RepID=UPI00342ACA19
MLTPDFTERQYSTFNLITGANRTIDILGFTGGSEALSSIAQTALQWAVDNYNGLNTTLQFNFWYKFPSYRYGCL